ncbi:ribokinase [Micrococcales bacterium KH10]|nr:ribokinase [Micrococcales bacterium KH10]
MKTTDDGASPRLDRSSSRVANRDSANDAVEMNAHFDVIVVGSLNHDIVVAVDRRPGAGETVVGTGISHGCGGKGGNQATAAALAGAEVALLAALGDDQEGAQQIAELTSCGVDTRFVIRSSEQRTSMALITVTDDGENAIVVTPGANDLVTARQVLEVLDDQEISARVVLAQSELGAAACDAAAELARRIGARFVLSNGPVVRVDPDTWALCDPVIVNEHEAKDVIVAAGETVPVPLDPVQLARRLQSISTARSVVITLGASGSVFGPGAGGEYERVPATKVETVIDTTGAGDTYAGAAAAALAGGASLAQACIAAANAAAASVRWPGARPPIAPAATEGTSAVGSNRRL